MDREQLRFIISTRFPESEFRQLVEKLGLDYDTDIKGNDFRSKAHNIVNYMETENRLPELEQTARDVSPSAFK